MTFSKKRATHTVIRERPLEKSFCHDLYYRIMIRPHGAVLPTGMGMVEIPTELSKAVCLLVKNDTVKGVLHYVKY